MDSILMNIIVGAIGSIVATIVLYLCSILYKPRYKEEFKFNLEAAKIATYQIQNQHLFPEDYGLVINQIDVLHQSVFKMYRTLYPMSMWLRKKEKKLIITLLHDVRRVCERSKFMTVGYSGETEKQARLEEIHRCFYKYSPLEEDNNSTVDVQLDVISCLVDGNDVTAK